MNETNEHASAVRTAACHLHSHPTPAMQESRALTPAQTEFLLSGNRLDVRLPGGAIARLAFAADRSVRAWFPDGSEDRGTWSVEDDGRYCIRWVAGPALSCTRVSRAADGLRLDDADGRPRGAIAAIVPGP